MLLYFATKCSKATLHSPVADFLKEAISAGKAKGPGNSFSMRLRDAGPLEAFWDKDSNEFLLVLYAHLLYHYPFIHTQVSNRKDRASHRIQEVMGGRELCLGSLEVSELR